MGLLNNVIRKDNQVAIAGEDKKLLLNINTRIEDLKLQNMENAKFLRGLSRKIETELEQLKAVESNKSIEVKDESKVINSIERVEKALEEINNNDVMEEIDRINKTLEESVSKIDSSVSKIDTEQMASIIGVVDKMQNKIDKVQEEFNSISRTVEEVSNKVNSVITLPNNIKNLMENQNNDMTENLETLYKEMGNEQEKKASTMKIMVGVNLWLTFLNVALIIAYIVGIFK